MIKAANVIFKPITGLFIVVSILCSIFSAQLDGYKIDHKVLLYANLIFFILTIITALLQIKALHNNNSYAFVRSITIGSFLKLIVIAASVLIYLNLAGENRSIYAIGLAMIIYILYTILEVKGAMRLNKNRDAES